MTKSPKHRLNKMLLLSASVEHTFAPSAQHRGFAISRLISHWHHIVGDLSEWCRPASIHFARGTRNNGTLRLQITSGRGPQAQAMSQQIINLVNTAFGYHAVSRITLTQSHAPIRKIEKAYKPPTISDAKDVWALDEKLKNIKSPELRAALRRLGGPVDQTSDDDP